MSLTKDIVDIVTANLADDLVEAAKRGVRATRPGRRIEKALNPDQLHERTRAILSEALAEVLDDLAESDAEGWKSVFEHLETRQQMIIWVLEWREEAKPTLGEWSLENAPNAEMLHGLLLRIHATIQEKKRKHFPPDFFNLQQGQAEILSAVTRGTALIARELEERLPEHREGDLDAEIDAAAKFNTDGKPDTALELLERLHRHEWGRARDREKYRILANIGHAHRLTGNLGEAARLYLEAKQFQPADENARWMEALAYGLRNDLATAHRLASQLMLDFPEFARATAVWIGSAPLDLPFDEIESAVRAGQRGDQEVAINLARQAAQRGEWGKAEHYGRRVLEGDPAWTEAKIHLASILLGRHMAETRQAIPGVLDPDAHSKVQECVSLFSSAIGELPRYTDASQTAQIRIELAAAHQLLGEHSKAAEMIVAAHESAPQDPEVQHAYAGYLVNAGKLDEAVDLLRAHPGSLSRDLLLAQTLATRNQGDDREGAITLLELTDERASELQAEAPPGVQAEWVRVLLRLHLSTQAPEATIAVLESLAADWLPPEEKLVFKAEAALAAGDDAEAHQEASHAMGAITDQSHPAVVRQLAVLFHRLGKYSESLELWQRIVQPDSVTLESDYLMDCAERAGRQDIILDFCAKLRQAGQYEPRYIRAEVAHLEVVSLQDTVQVLLQLIEAPLEEAFKQEVRAWLSHVAIRIDKKDLIDTDADHLPKVEDVENVRTGGVVVEVLRHGPDPLKAVRYAYELFRKFPDHLDAHMAVVNSVVWSKIDVEEPASVGPGTAVKYAEDDSQRETWVIVEDAAEPRAILGEHSPDSPIAQAMIGKARGDHFTVREKPRRTATILELANKYVYRFQKCMREMESNFPGSSPMFAIQIPKKPDGTPDVERALEQIVEVQGDSNEAEEFYREKPMPLYMLGRHLGASTFEVVQQIAGRLPMKCCVGALQERKAAFAAMNTASAIVLDPSALATLFLLQMQGVLEVQAFLERLPFERIVSEHTVAMLRKLKSFRYDGNGERLFVGASKGKVSVSLASADEMRRAKDAVERLIHALELACNVVPGRALATTGAEDKKLKETALELFGKAGVDSMLLAVGPGQVLWTDDLASAVIACPGLSVRRTWTQAVLLWMADKGHLAKEIEQKATLGLLLADHTFTSMRPDHVLLAIENEGWQADAPRLQPVWKYLGNPSLDLPSRFSLASGVLKEVWKRDRLHVKAQAITFRILSELRCVRDGRRVIAALLEHADRIFGVDVLTADAFKQAITGWLDTDRGIVAP